MTDHLESARKALSDNRISVGDRALGLALLAVAEEIRTLSIWISGGKELDKTGESKMRKETPVRKYTKEGFYIDPGLYP